MTDKGTFTCMSLYSYVPLIFDAFVLCSSWLNTTMVENRKIFNTTDMDGFDKRKLPSSGFQVEIVLVDYDGTPVQPLSQKPRPEHLTRTLLRTRNQRMRSHLNQTLAKNPTVEPKVNKTEMMCFQMMLTKLAQEPESLPLNPPSHHLKLLPIARSKT